MRPSLLVSLPALGLALGLGSCGGPASGPGRVDVPVAAPRAASTSLDAPTPRHAEAVPAADAEPDPFPVLHAEGIGPFAIGMSKEEALRLAPGLRSTGPVIEEGATAEWVEIQIDPASGLSIAFSSLEEHAPKTVRSIRIESPSRLVTRRGVAIGATYASVLAEYGDVLDRDFPPTATTIIAGSLYGGLIVSFERGVAKQIFLGAGAE